ncbi:MAG: MFS transporter, partial [Caulobacterales bacterium]|nr:MFS transporter [Caulobacterales bacterium]
GFVASFAISLGPVMWILLSEIFPSRVRGAAISFVTVFNSGSSFLVQFLFPIQLATIGIEGVFAGYALFALIGLGLVAWLMPETKSLTLEEIESTLAAKGARA